MTTVICALIINTLKKLFIIFFINIQVLDTIYANNIISKEGISSESNSYVLSKNLIENYILGPGDHLKILIYDVPELNYETKVLADGSIPIPYSGQILISGLTIQQAERKVIKVLSKELIRPDAQIKVLKVRPISISILGEVNKPGTYILDNNLNYEKNKITNKTNIPNLVNAIKLAGGITNNANLNKVQIQRKNSLIEINNSKVDKRTLNFKLSDLLINGDQSQNPLLFDGDVIKISKANEMSSQVNRSLMANLSPDEIRVNIIGEVFNPGTILVDPATSLMEGIFIAGGPKYLRAKNREVKLIRIRNNGTIVLKKFNMNLNKTKSNKNNPLLLDGDTVLVGRTNLAQSLICSTQFQGLLTR